MRRSKPLAVPSTRRLPPPDAVRVEAASADASTSAFHLGVLIAGLLMIAGGVVAGFGIDNPRRRIEAVPSRGSAAAGECGHGAGADTQPKQAPAPEAA